MIIRTSSSQFFGYHMQDSPVYNLGNYHQNNEQVNYTYSPWLKKSLDFNFLKCSKMKNLSQFLTEYLHHGCKKFCISILWNAPKWRIWVILAQKIQKISTPRGKHYGNWQRRFYSIVVLFSYSEEQRAEIWYTKWSLWTIVALVKTTSKPKIMDYWILRVFCL